MLISKAKMTQVWGDRQATKPQGRLNRQLSWPILNYLLHLYLLASQTAAAGHLGSEKMQYETAVRMETPLCVYIHLHTHVIY